VTCDLTRQVTSLGRRITESGAAESLCNLVRIRLESALVRPLQERVTVQFVFTEGAHKCAFQTGSRSGVFSLIATYTSRLCDVLQLFLDFSGR
jgi:hypothetical protein